MESINRREFNKERQDLKNSAFTAWRIEAKISALMGNSDGISYSEYLEQMQLLDEAELEAIKDLRDYNKAIAKKKAEAALKFAYGGKLKEVDYNFL